MYSALSCAEDALGDTEFLKNSESSNVIKHLLCILQGPGGKILWFTFEVQAQNN